MTIKLAVLITCHNRREATLSCLQALFDNMLSKDVLLDVFLVDDGSSDGTGDDVSAVFPQVRILRGDGTLYWNGGMRKAFTAAMEYDYDYYLWLNDDTILYSQTVSSLITVAESFRRNQKKSVVVVGSTLSTDGTRVTYGGIVKWTRLKSKLVEPRQEPVTCETMNGNCVLVPREIARVVGNLDPVFVHSIGDVDYGLRVGKAGFEIMVMPGYAGTCDHNPVKDSCNDITLSLRCRIDKVLGPKGLPPKPWFIFLWRHFRVLGLLYWVWTYAKVFPTWAFARCFMK